MVFPQMMPAYTHVRATSPADTRSHVAPKGMPLTWYAYLRSVRLFFSEAEYAPIHQDAADWLRQRGRQCELEGGDQCEDFTPLGVPLGSRQGIFWRQRPSPPTPVIPPQPPLPAGSAPCTAANPFAAGKGTSPQPAAAGGRSISSCRWGGQYRDAGFPGSGVALWTHGRQRHSIQHLHPTSSGGESG